MKPNRLGLNSFPLFFKGLGNTWREMWISLQLLVLVTLVLSLILYFVEHAAQPEVYDGFGNSVLWSFMQYIGDPGNFADYKPVTVVGRIIAAIIGFIGIAIFVIPAGIIGTGFVEAIADEKKKRKLKEASTVLHKRFRRSGQSNSWYINEKGTKSTYKYVPRYKSIALLQVKTGMTQDELIETVNFCPDMRLNNLSTTQRMVEQPMDRLVVEHFPLNTEYGCFIDRESDVTIVSTASYSHIGLGTSAFSLAAMGGFNYVSVEIDPCPDEPFGFFGMNQKDLEQIADYDVKENAESQALHFMDALKSLKKNSHKRNRRHWFFFLHGCLKTDECQVHFRRNATDKDKQLPNRLFNEAENREYGSLVLAEDEETYQKIVAGVREILQKRKVTIKGNEQDIVTQTDNYKLWKSINESNVMCRMEGGINCNAINLRIADEIVVYSNCHLLIMKDIADTIKACIEPEHEIDEKAKKCFLESGNGFADDYGLISDPVELNKQLKMWKKEMLKNYEHLDLDWNEQADYAEHHTFWKELVAWFRNIIS